MFWSPKALNPNAIKKKKQLWEQLSHNMRKIGVERDPSNLRSAYYRFKQQAKSAVGAYKRYFKKTGGGPGPSTEPTELEWAIANICPIDFEEDEPLLDSDDRSLNVTLLFFINVFLHVFHIFRI
jgi:hypothetical protein